MDNQHEQIAGYRDLDQAEIDGINEVKAAEVALAQVWRTVSALPDVDRRWLAVARTHFQEGASALVRAIARPADPFEG